MYFLVMLVIVLFIIIVVSVHSHICDYIIMTNANCNGTCEYTLQLPHFYMKILIKLEHVLSIIGGIHES